MTFFETFERSKVGLVVRAVLSAVATVAGVALLMADSTDDCEEYLPVRAELDYSTTCPLLSGGGTGGGGGSSGSAGGGGSAAMGHVSLSIPKLTSNADIESSNAATAAFRAGGLRVLDATIGYAGDCSGNDGTGTPVSFHLTLGTDGTSVFDCHTLALPVRQQTAACKQTISGAQPASCTLTVTPTR